MNNLFKTKPLARIISSLLLGVALHTPVHAIGNTEQISLDINGQEVDGASVNSSVSANGRYVAFQSAATNLVADDTNGKTDIFVADRQTGTITRVSVSSAGDEANGNNYDPSISADGRFVAFETLATNLFADADNNGFRDIAIHDRQTGATTILGFGTGVQGIGDSFNPQLSADGRIVIFDSDASNIVNGDNNNSADVFLRDRQIGITERISVSSAGVEGDKGSFYPSLSADGRFVAFQSNATNLVANDTNAQTDVFIRDRQTKTTTRVSLRGVNVQAIGGGSNYPSLSADGRFVAFQSTATNLVIGDTNKLRDIFLRDRLTNITTRLSVSSAGLQATGGNSSNPIISADGRFVTFDSGANKLVAADTNKQIDTFLRDRQTNTTTRVSVRANGAQALGGYSGFPSLSADGRFIGFSSDATNLVTGDNNDKTDIFLRDNTINPALSANLVLVGTATPNPVDLGGVLTYTFTVSNAGPSAVTEVSLFDTLTAQLLVATVTPSQGTCNKANLVVCRLGALAKGQKATVTIKAKVKNTAPSVLFNTASVQANAKDLLPANNHKTLATKTAP